MYKKTFFTLLISILILPIFVSADSPPPPPFTVNFTYEGQKINDSKFYAVALQCRQEKISDIFVIPQLDINQSDTAKTCSWMPRLSTSGGFCVDSICHFDWVYGQFKLAVYIPSLDKTFISEMINREYLGHYGRKTQTVYDVNLSKDSGITVNNVMIVNNTNSIFNAGFLALMTISFIATIILESIVALVFFLLKKVKKNIFLAVLIGNLVSVPFVWVIDGTFPFFTGLLYLSEIIVVVFEAWLIKLFAKKMLSWKMCLLISLIMNIASFIVGQYFIILLTHI